MHGTRVVGSISTRHFEQPFLKPARRASLGMKPPAIGWRLDLGYRSRSNCASRRETFRCCLATVCKSSSFFWGSARNPRPPRPLKASGWPRSEGASYVACPRKMHVGQRRPRCLVREGMPSDHRASCLKPTHGRGGSTTRAGHSRNWPAKHIDHVEHMPLSKLCFVTLVRHFSCNTNTCTFPHRDLMQLEALGKNSMHVWSMAETVNTITHTQF